MKMMQLTDQRSTRRGFLGALLVAPVLGASAAALSTRASGGPARPPIRPAALAPQVNPGANLVTNGDFELDEMGTTFTGWVLGTPLAVRTPSTEGIPPTR